MIKLFKSSKLIDFIIGGSLAAAFAPVFFTPALTVLAILGHKVRKAQTWKESASIGFWFGFGFFTFGLYWMAIGVSVYADEFWWAIPFALFGLPSVLAIFILIGSALSWRFRASNYYILIFSIIWVALEWVRSWIFTGLPWNLLGYSLVFSDQLIQLGSLVGTYGMSFLVIYLSVGMLNLFDEKKRNPYFIFFILIVASSIIYGDARLKKYPTAYTDIKIRLVQPSIAQTDKWDLNTFWHNLDSHIALSRLNTGFEPDIILWSEAAVTAPHNFAPIKDRLKSALLFDNSILITGGVSDNKNLGRDEIYSSMYAMNNQGDILFEYYKAHLVPFGEYIPLSSILPIKKLTPGLEDYAEGERNKKVELQVGGKSGKKSIKIKPLICYEAIFPAEVRTPDVDVIFNITNDTWYGNSSGPYQHFQMTRLRAVENGVPLIRSANSGISAIIDPLGKVLSKTSLGDKTVLDGLIPQKIDLPPKYTFVKEFILFILIFLVVLMHHILEKLFSIIKS